MIIFSAHGDTNFNRVSLRVEGDEYWGYLDNFSGVYAMLKAYFSGEINFPYVRTEITYDEEVDFAGAIEVAKTIKKDDLVVVIDVTGTETEKDFVIEKCQNKIVREFLDEILTDFSVDIYKHCPDPVSSLDEVDIYKHQTPYYFFLGVPVAGGDYNDDENEVSCKIKSIDEIAKVIIHICKNYHRFEELKNES